MKKLGKIIVSCLTLSLILSACTTSAPQQSSAPAASQAPSSSAPAASETTGGGDKPLNIVYVPPLIAHPVWLVAKQGFEDAAKDLGFNGQWVGPTQNDVNEVVKQIEIAITSKADGIITYGAEPTAMKPVLQKAADAGIPVVTVIGDVDDVAKLGFMGTDPDNFGRTGARVLSEKMGDQKINLVGQMFALDAAQNIANFEGYKNGLAEHKAGYEWLTTSASNSDMATSMQEWEKAITTYPEVNAFITSSGEGAAAASKVLKERNLVGKITVIGIDDMQETLDAIRDGSVYATLTQNFYRCGYQAAEWIVDYHKSGKTPADPITDTGTIVVTQKNVETYINELMDRSSWNK